MKYRSKKQNPFMLFVFALMMVSLACSTIQPPTPTNTPVPTATITPTSTNTPRPSPTLRPTKTPDLAATQHTDELNAEVQGYFDKGYLTTTKGTFKELDDFQEECAQLGSYCWWLLKSTASDFYMTAHFQWSSAYRSADISGCGFIFATQDNQNKTQYAAFLDRSQVYFVQSDYYYRSFKPTRGTGKVSFDNPADHPVEADFTLIVKGAYAYVIVDDEVIGEYTLSQTKNLRGGLGVAILSGTNKDYGTRCGMSNLHIWMPTE